MKQNCDYTDEELNNLLRGTQTEWEEAMRCLFKGGHLKRETTAFLLKAGATPQDAEEAYSEGSRVFLENIIRRKFEGRSSPKTYFISICEKIWLGKKKSAWRKRFSFFENALDLDRQLTETPDRKTDIESLERFIDQLLQQTTERCREMYWLEVGGHSHAEIAEITEQSSTQYVKTAVYRCKQRLRAIIAASPDLTDFFKKYFNGK